MPSASKRGFTLAETLITVAVVGVIAAIGTITAAHVIGKSREQKFFSDVSTLNRGVISYIASGGDLSEAKDATEVLSAMKRSFANASRIPGLSGAKIDERLSFSFQSADEAEGDGWRAYWSDSTQRFVIARSGDGPGIKSFGMDGVNSPLGEGEVATNAKTPLLYAEQGTWIWDYKDTAASVLPGPSDINVGEVPDTTPSSTTPSGPPPSAASPLAAPTFSIASGGYPIGSFNLPLTLYNPNPSGSSDLYYSVDFGNWKPYSGALQVPPGSIVAAQAIATSNLYRNSARVDQSYSAIPANLSPPVITPSLPEFGLFSGRQLTVTLSDLNPTSISVLEYRIGGDPWQVYTGPFTLNRNSYPSGALVQARAVPQNPYYIASSATLRTLGVEQAVITGNATGSFSDPSGSGSMLTNLLPGGSSDYFAWGRDFLLGGEFLSLPLGGILKQSSLEFEGKSFNGINGGERFELGSLSYYNGTIVNGSGADAISFATDLTFSLSGVAVSRTFNFDFELINVANQNNPSDPWADADFVKLANPLAGETLNFNGILYQFQLEFGETTPAGISLFDEFHVLEGRNAVTKVYGTLVEVGSVSFNN